jgi:hypothetical protein
MKKLLNIDFRAKYGPKKASSKTHHHFYLMGMLKRVSRIYMEKKLQLTRADRLQDIQLSRAEGMAAGESPPRMAKFEQIE